MWIFSFCAAVDHLGRQNARRAVKRRERLVDLRHLAADGRLLLDDIDLKAGVRDIERGLNARDAAADDKRALCNGAFAGRKRRVELYLCDGCSAENDSLFRALSCMSLWIQEHCSRMFAISTM